MSINPINIINLLRDKFLEMKMISSPVTSEEQKLKDYIKGILMQAMEKGNQVSFVLEESPLKMVRSGSYSNLICLVS